MQSDAALTRDDAHDLADTLKPQRLLNQSSLKTIYPRGVHPTTDSSEEIDSSDNEQIFAVTDVNFKGYMGKSSNFDLIRTVMDLKREHDATSTNVEYERPFTEDHERFTPVRVRRMSDPVTTPLS